MMKCLNCHHQCEIEEGGMGFCKARGNRNGKIVSLNYGLVTSLALDPIEKKPLKEFFPKSQILSIGSYGCNLKCPFCQNYEISQIDLKKDSESYSPEELVSMALSLLNKGNIGIAFTYNEPLVSPEFMFDTFKLAKSKGLKTVLVSNGSCSLEVIRKLTPYIDAMNIDLKGFNESFYSWVGGSLQEVKAFLSFCANKCHLEVTTLVIPGKNDSADDMEKEASFLASLNPSIPLHLTRYFPQYLCKIPITPIATLQKLEAVAKRYLKSVYLGNI